MKFISKILKNKVVFILLVFLLIATVIGIIFGIKQYKEKERQEKIEQVLTESGTYYNNLDFENVLKCYDELDTLQYNTADIRAIVEYDKSVYEVSKTFYETVCDVDTKLHSESYSSLSELMSTLKKPMKEFDALEINMDSKIGTYINNTRNNIMYVGLKSEFVYNDKYDLDYGLTSWGYALAIETYTEVLVNEGFPYEGEE